MKAVICNKYGPPEVLQIENVEKPAPKPNELLVKVIAATAHIGDTKIRRFEPGMGPVRDFFFKPMMRLILGFRGPRKKILGMEFSGIVEETGKNVTQFKPGDEVFASTGIRFGAYAEYCCISENAIITLKPSNMSHEEAAPVPNGAITAMKHLRTANVKKGDKVLIYGASGSVGTYAVQLAKYWGAEVTGVCSTGNLEMVRSIGADKVIDYIVDDFTLVGGTYDVIYDAVGKIKPDKRNKSLSANGIYINVLTAKGSIKMQKEELYFIKDLCEAGVLKTVIDRKYKLDEIVEAHRYVDKGHKKGNVVVVVN